MTLKASLIDYPVAINLADLLALCQHDAVAIDRLLLNWIADAELVTTEDGPAFPLRPADTPIRQQALSGLVHALARQESVRSYGFLKGRWRLIGVPPQRKLW